MAKDWVTAELSLDPLLKPIYPILEGLNGILSALIAILNIVQKILDIIKAFLVGLLDPLRALVEIIIEEIRGIIRDLRQIGLYIAGDWALVDSENNHAYLLGGYATYEQRMVARLLDTTDPNRPNFSSSSAALGVFLYVSSGDISVIIRAVFAIMKLFGQDSLMGKQKPYPTPTAPTIGYGSAAAGVSAFASLGRVSADNSPDSISITWSMPTGTSKSPFKNPSPKGFLIHVSTIPDGLEVVASTSNPTSPNPNEPPRIIGGAVDPINNSPLKLYGGVADLGVESDPQDFSTVEQLTSPQAPLLFLKKDQVTPLIKPSTLAPASGPPILGNTYYVKMSDLSPQRIGGGTQFTATLKVADLPLEASFKGGSDGFAEIEGNAAPAKNYWVRVRALTTNYVKYATGQGLTGSLMSPGSVYDSKVRIFEFSNGSIKGAAGNNGVISPDSTGGQGVTPAELSFKDITAAGGPAVATIPTENQLSYQKALQTALALAILCRADLTETTKSSPYGIPNLRDRWGQNLYAMGYALGFEAQVRGALGSLQIDENFFKETRPQTFREKLRKLLVNFQPNSPPEGVIESIIGDAKDLLEFKWSMLGSGYPALTILESIGIGGDPSETEGVGANPFCRSQPKTYYKISYLSAATVSERLKGPERTPSFMIIKPTPYWLFGDGSADNSPIIYQDKDTTETQNTKTQFIRNAVYNYKDQILLKEASIILGVAMSNYAIPDTDGGWLTIRLMPQALVPLDQLLTKVDKFLQGVLDGLQGVIDQIIKYIEAIQARIYQLQALLELIQSLLQSIAMFRLPSLSALVLVENGTAGLTTGLITSGNKPQDDSNDYGGGVVAVAGGIPTVLLETLGLIFSGGGE